MKAARDLKRRDRYVGKGMDPAELARAEETLRDTGDAQLSPEWIDATVAKVTGAAPRRFLLRRGVSIAAAVVLFAVLVAAASSMLWPEKQFSHLTMEYPNAVRILVAGVESEEEHLSALKKVHGQIASAVKTLRQIKCEADTESAVVTAIDKHLASMLHAVEAATLPKPDCGQLDEVIVMAAEAQRSRLDPAQCLAAMERLTASALTGIQVMRQLPDATPDVLQAAAIFVRRLATLLHR